MPRARGFLAAQFVLGDESAVGLSTDDCPFFFPFIPRSIGGGDPFGIFPAVLNDLS